MAQTMHKPAGVAPANAKPANKPAAPAAAPVPPVGAAAPAPAPVEASPYADFAVQSADVQPVDDNKPADADVLAKLAAEALSDVTMVNERIVDGSQVRVAIAHAFEVSERFVGIGSKVRLYTLDQIFRRADIETARKALSAKAAGLTFPASARTPQENYRAKMLSESRTMLDAFAKVNGTTTWTELASGAFGGWNATVEQARKILKGYRDEETPERKLEQFRRVAKQTTLDEAKAEERAQEMFSDWQETEEAKEAQREMGTTAADAADGFAKRVLKDAKRGEQWLRDYAARLSAIIAAIDKANADAEAEAEAGEQQA